jgi:hypothetical protein
MAFNTNADLHATLFPPVARAVTKTKTPAEQVPTACDADGGVTSARESVGRVSVGSGVSLRSE